MTAKRLHRGAARSISLFVALLSMIVAACSSADRDPSPAMLRVMMTDDWVTDPFLDAVRDFERSHPQVRVVVDKQPIRSILDTIRGRAKGESVPDVVQGHAFAAAARGLAQPLDDLWNGRLDAAEFFPGAIADVTWAGRRYGVPLDTNALVLIYNADDFKAAGLPLPNGAMTLEELQAVARALTPADKSRRALALPTSTWRTFGWVAANGGEWVKVSPDGKPEFAFDSPESVEALRFLSGLVNEGLAYPPRAAETHASDVYAMFESGTTSMYTSGSWDIVKLRASRPSVDYRAALMPKGHDGATVGSAMGGSSLLVPIGSEQRKLAFDFMLHVTSDRYALRLAKEEGRLPVRSRVYADPFFQDPVLQVVVEQLKTARPEKLDGFPEAGQALAKAIDQVLRSEKDPAEALREAQAQAVASLGS